MHSYCELSREGDKIGFFICIHPYPSDETDADDDDADAMQSCFVHFKAIAKVVGRNREIAYTRFVDPIPRCVLVVVVGARALS